MQFPGRLARAHDLLNDWAVDIVAVVPGSPADTAGLQRGDLMVSMNGRIISGLDDLHRNLSGFQANRQLLVTAIQENVFSNCPSNHGWKAKGPRV